MCVCIGDIGVYLLANAKLVVQGAEVGGADVHASCFTVRNFRFVLYPNVIIDFFSI